MAVEQDFWRGRRVLVTGHTGFKGSWLSLWLHTLGAEVTGLSDRVPTDPSLFELARVGELVEDLRLDVRDHAAVREVFAEHRPQTVLHLAAQPIVRLSFAEPRETFEVNVMGTVNVLDAARQAEGVESVVVVTSDKCYENREWEWAYREYEAMGGFEPYSASKGAAELVAQAYRRSFFSGDEGPRIATARAGNVIGGGDWAADRLVPDIMRAALAGDEIRVRNPDSQRPWQHVLNPLSGYLMLVQALHENPDHGGGWNFGPPDEDARPVSWIIERIAELWPGELRSSFDPGPHPPEARYLKLDSSKARMALGWSPRWDLAQSLDSIVEWYRGLDAGEDMRALTLAQIEAYAQKPAAV